MNVDEGERHGWIAEEEALLRELLAREVPLLGLCLGGQLLAAGAGAEIISVVLPDAGHAMIRHAARWHRLAADGVGRVLRAAAPRSPRSTPPAPA